MVTAVSPSSLTTLFDSAPVLLGPRGFSQNLIDATGMGAGCRGCRRTEQGADVHKEC